MKQMFKNQKIIVLIIFLMIGILSICGLLFILKEKPGADKAHLISEYPWGGCREINGYDPKVDYKYNYMSALDITIEKEGDKHIIIGKDAQKRTFSLGKFKLHLEPNSMVFIPKLWIYFSSEKLSDREDKLYGLEDSYLSKIVFRVGNNTKEVKLGKTGEHSFIELDNCPIGNFDAVNYNTEQEFEFLLEISCNNFKDGKCLDNKGKSLDYINGADLSALIRFFVVSMQSFNKDIDISTEFKYE